ncbi:regulatory protein [Streptomyces sp. e14]|uniref:ATP-binding protein n=1 Tax=Streptomyces sp. e14 TaxID=645465 RepID=UPI0001D064A8|nr:regulatory protein [Streptomyces sp. e14]
MPLRAPVTQSSCLCVPSDISAVPSARREVVAIIRAWGLPLSEDEVGTLESPAGEVIANAVVHTPHGCRVTVSWDGARVRLEAEDEKAGPLPERVATDIDIDAGNGRGLRLVDSLALAWGSHPSTTGGKTVWFEVGSCRLSH